MRRNQLVFFGIIALAVVIIGAGLLIQAGLSGGETEPTATPVNPIILEVAVNPLLEPWVSQAAEAYQRTQPTTNGRTVTLQVTQQDSLAVWGEGTGVWSAQEHPSVWIPETSYAISYAQEGARLAFDIHQPSLAETPLIWGAYESRSSVIVNQFGTLDAETVQEAATIARWEDLGGNSRWQFIKIAMPRPNSTEVGLASLLTLIGDAENSPTLTSAQLSDTTIQDSLKPIIDLVPNFSTLGNDPALVMATRGTSIAEIGLLPESQWLAHFDALNAVESLVLSYPNEYVLLDFPFAIWGEADERRAAEAFAAFLMNDDQQGKLGELGFRPTTRRDDVAQFAPFIAAEGQVQLSLGGSPIALPDRPAILALLRWFANYRTAP